MPTVKVSSSYGTFYMNKTVSRFQYYASINKTSYDFSAVPHVVERNTTGGNMIFSGSLPDHNAYLFSD